MISGVKEPQGQRAETGEPAAQGGGQVRWETPGRAEPPFCFGFLRVCSLTLDSQLSLPGLNVLIIEMGRLDSLSSQIFLP